MKYYAKFVELAKGIHPYFVNAYDWPDRKEICLDDVSKKWRIVDTAGWRYLVAENVDASYIAVNERYGDEVMYSGSSDISPLKTISAIYNSKCRKPLGIAVRHEDKYKILYLAGYEGIYRR